VAKLVLLYPEPADRKAFDDYYFNTHVPIALKIPGLRSYEVSKGVTSSDAAKVIHLVAELGFDTMEDLNAALASAESAAAGADLVNFAPPGVESLIFETRQLV